MDGWTKNAIRMGVQQAQKRRRLKREAKALRDAERAKLRREGTP